MYSKDEQTAEEASSMLVRKDTALASKGQILEAWIIDYGGKYHAVDDNNNYLVVDDMRDALRFAVSDHNDKLTDLIRKNTALRAGFGPSQRKLVQWTRGKHETAIIRETQG